MDRRELLTAAVRTGTVLLSIRMIAPEEEAAAGTAAAQFFRGPFTGLGVDGGTIGLSTLGTRAGGTVYDAGKNQVFRLEGRLKGNRLTLGVFAGEDINLTTRLGSLTANRKKQAFKGKITLDAGGSASFIAAPIKLSAKLMKRFAGTYEGHLLDAQGNELATADAVLKSSGTFQLRNIERTPPPGAPALDESLPSKAAGRWGIEVNGNAALAFLNKIEQPIDDPDVHNLVVTMLVADFVGEPDPNDFSFQAGNALCGCAVRA
jgi:hypothetical protein